MRILGKFVLVLFALLFVALPASAQGYDPSNQTPQLWLYEAQTVYYTNLQRAENDLPPLRWNQQLTHAARWFSWDSTENRPANFCGHTDSLGREAWDRAPLFGYLGWAGAENAYCGLMMPDDAVNGWMNSPGHRDNILDPGWREVGLGYYDSDKGGYITQDFGSDAAHAPVVINHEQPSTTNPNVDLYIYDGDPGTFGGFGPAQEMQISGDACFASAEWQPYQQQVNWTLEPAGEGWQTVYVQTRDALHRSRVVSDVIYYGNPPTAAMADPVQFSTTSGQVDLVGLESNSLPLMQFSLGWQADDSNPTFQRNGGTGRRVNDASAWGGTAFRMDQAASGAWAWTREFPRNTPMVAYARLKISNNTSADTVVTFSVTGGDDRSISGQDFAQAGVYQEFALRFTVPSDEEYVTLNIFSFTNADVYVDTVTFFSEPVPYEEDYTLDVPGGNYRGQGVWVRNVNADLTEFSEIEEAGQHQARLTARPASLHATAMQGKGLHTWFIRALQVCNSTTWTYSSSGAGWLDIHRDGEFIYLSANPDVLSLGKHSATLILTPDDDTIPPVEVPIQIDVIEPRVQYSFPFTYLTP